MEGRRRIRRSPTILTLRRPQAFGTLAHLSVDAVIDGDLRNDVFSDTMGGKSLQYLGDYLTRRVMTTLVKGDSRRW